MNYLKVFIFIVVILLLIISINFYSKAQQIKTIENLYIYGNELMENRLSK